MSSGCFLIRWVFYLAFSNCFSKITSPGKNLIFSPGIRSLASISVEVGLDVGRFFLPSFSFSFSGYCRVLRLKMPPFRSLLGVFVGLACGFWFTFFMFSVFGKNLGVKVPPEVVQRLAPLELGSIWGRIHYRTIGENLTE